MIDIPISYIFIQLRYTIIVAINVVRTNGCWYEKRRPEAPLFDQLAVNSSDGSRYLQRSGSAIARLSIHALPGVVIREQSAQKLIVHGMSRPAGPDGTDNRATGKIQVANAIQNLVTDEFVVVAQAFFVEHLVAADDDCIIERAA